MQGIHSCPAKRIRLRRRFFRLCCAGESVGLAFLAPRLDMPLPPAPLHEPKTAPYHLGDLALALLSGVLLTSMVSLNGSMGHATTPVFSSVAAHVTGTFAAAVALVIGRMRRRNLPIAITPTRAPLWAYLAGLSGAVTVILTSTTVNSPLTLTGTLALGLAGQAGFALLSDRFGLFGLARRKPSGGELAALALILAGSSFIIFAGAFA